MHFPNVMIFSNLVSRKRLVVAQRRPFLKLFSAFVAILNMLHSKRYHRWSLMLSAVLPNTS